MTCEKAFSRYLALDKHERVPFAVTLHLLVCPSCRTSVRKLTRADALFANSFNSPVVESARETAIAGALARLSAENLIYPSMCPAEHTVSLYRWLICGIALVAGFAVMPFSPLGVWSRLSLGSSFWIPFYLLCGTAVTIYCGIFVGTNIDFFVKKFGFERTEPI